MLKLVPEIFTNDDSLMEADRRRNLTQRKYLRYDSKKQQKAFSHLASVAAVSHCQVFEL